MCIKILKCLRVTLHRPNITALCRNISITDWRAEHPDTHTKKKNDFLHLPSTGLCSQGPDFNIQIPLGGGVKPWCQWVWERCSFLHPLWRTSGPSLENPSKGLQSQTCCRRISKWRWVRVLEGETKMTGFLSITGSAPNNQTPAESGQTVRHRWC